MPSPFNSHSTDDDEYSEPITPTTLPYPDNELMDDDEEEEPFETDPASPHPVSPIEESRRNPPFTVIRPNSGAPWTTRGPRPRISVRAPETVTFTAPLDDPYRPPNYNLTPNFVRISSTLTQWRQHYGNPFSQIPETSTQAMTPLCPITREPPHHTIPLLVLRLADQEDEIDTLKDDVDHIKDSLEAIPSPEDIQGMQADIEFQWRTILDLRAEIDQLRRYVSIIPKVRPGLEEDVLAMENSMGALWAQSRAQDRIVADLAQDITRLGV